MEQKLKIMNQILIYHNEKLKMIVIFEAKTENSEKMSEIINSQNSNSVA